MHSVPLSKLRGFFAVAGVYATSSGSAIKRKPFISAALVPFRPPATHPLGSPTAFLAIPRAQSSRNAEIEKG
jgi:hypothetical protein